MFYFIFFQSLFFIFIQKKSWGWLQPPFFIVGLNRGHVLSKSVQLNSKYQKSRITSDKNAAFFRCEEHLYKRLRPSVRWLVRRSVPTMRLRGNANTWKRDCFEKRRRKRKLITSRFRYGASFAPRD
jgi:hypothetical protein